MTQMMLQIQTINEKGEREKNLTTGIQNKTSGVVCNLYLLMVFDAHADGVDQYGDHDASVEILALHNSPQLHLCVVPDLHALLLRTTPPMFFCNILVFFAPLLAARMCLPINLVHRSLLCFILCSTNGSHLISK